MNRRASQVAVLPQEASFPGGLLLISGILLLAFVLRVACLDCQSLWVDEAASAYWTAIPLQALLRDTADNLHVPAYFLLLRGWVDLTGASPFALRYFSVVSGLLLVATAYWFTRRLRLGRGSALLAALLAALSPAGIYYSQETRMYALLPLIYLLMLAQVDRLSRHSRWLSWTVLLALELFALYLHLFAGLMVLALNVLLLLVYWRQQRSRGFLAAWIGSQLVLALALTPWLWFTIRSGGSLPANLGDTTGSNATFALDDYLRQVWTLLATGLTDVRPFLTYWSLLFAIAVATLSLFSVVTASQPVRRRLLGLVVAILVPLLAAIPVWAFNPLTHPRYLFFLVGPLVVLIGHGLSTLFSQRNLWPAGAALLCLILLLDVAALGAARLDSSQQRYDSAALAAAIRQRGEPGDVVLMPPFDRSLWYYDPSPVDAANWPFAAGRQEGRPAELAQLLERYDRAFLVAYHDLYSYDPHSQLPFLLEANGHLVEMFTVDRMDVRLYDLTGWATPQLARLDVRCGPVQLTGAHFPPQARPGDAPTLALRWQLSESTTDRIVASARLIDGEEVLSSSDHTLLDGAGLSTNRWAPGTEATTYFILPLPLGAPPLDYGLDVLLYAANGDPITCGDDGDAIRLGKIALVEADQRAVDAYGTWADTSWQTPAGSDLFGGVALEGFSVRPQSILPAQPMYVTLKWRARRDAPQLQEPLLVLMNDGDVVERSGGNLFARHPASRWREGDLFIETRQLEMPVSLDPFQLAIVTEGTAHPLDQVRVDVSALHWAVPETAHTVCARFQDVGALRGYEIQEADDGASANLTLYWQADEEARASVSYTVFAQLLAPDGQIASQDDGLPAEGERPTTSWLPGEVIVDEHQLDLPAGSWADYRLAVGLYDLPTLQRIPAYSCQGDRLSDDALTIPLTDAN